MIRRGALKFIHSPPDSDQLYDLRRDSGERDNLAGKPGHAAEVAEFRAEVTKRWDLVALDAEVRASQRRRLVDAALMKGEIRGWDFQPFRDANETTHAQQHGPRRSRGDGPLPARRPRIGPQETGGLARSRW